MCETKYTHLPHCATKQTPDAPQLCTNLSALLNMDARPGDVALVGDEVYDAAAWHGPREMMKGTVRWIIMSRNLRGEPTWCINGR